MVMMKNITFMIMNLENIFITKFGNDKHRRRRGIQYATIIILVFIFTHFMAANYVEDVQQVFTHHILKKE